MMTFRLDESMYFVVLSRYGDHYEWNKVVTCIHNVLSQQRYLEHYGEVTIRNLKSNTCTCKITFVKVTETTSCSTRSFSLWMLLCSSVLILIFWIVFCCSLVIGAQIPTRTRCRARCWTRAGVSSTGSEVCGMKASSATLCPLRNVSGSQVSPRSSPHDLFTALFLLEFEVIRPSPKLLISINPSVTFVLQLTSETCVTLQIPSRRMTCCTTASPPSPWSWMNSPRSWSLSCLLQTAACAQTKGEESNSKLLFLSLFVLFQVDFPAHLGALRSVFTAISLFSYVKVSLLNCSLSS